MLKAWLQELVRAPLEGVIEQLSLANSGSYGLDRFCSGLALDLNPTAADLPLDLNFQALGLDSNPTHPLTFSQHPLKAEQQQLAQDVCPVLLALDARLLRGTKWHHELCEGTNRPVRRREGEQQGETQHHRRPNNTAISCLARAGLIAFGLGLTGCLIHSAPRPRAATQTPPREDDSISPPRLRVPRPLAPSLGITISTALMPSPRHRQKRGESINCL